MKFIHITDIHLVGKGSTLHEISPQARLKSCLEDITKWHSDAAFCVISGDLAEFGDEQAYLELKEQLSSFSMPCFLLVGNHDDRTVFQSVFKDYPKDPNGFVQHRHEVDNKVFLFLDTNKDGHGVHEGQLCSKRLAWLKAQLIEAQEKPTYIFLHHPPFEIGISYVDHIKLVEVEAFAETIAIAKNLRHIFYGHVHRMTYVNWRGISFTSLCSLSHHIPLNPNSTESPFCDEAPAYGVVETTNDQLTINFNTFLQRNVLMETS